jgi:hypothetical protein
MNSRWIAIVALAAALVVPAAARAHDGKDKTVMGTVTSVDGTNLMVKTADGKQTMVMLDAKTAITQGKTKVALSVVKIGDRVVASGPEEQSMIMAETLKLSTVGTMKPNAVAAAKPAAKK